MHISMYVAICTYMFVCASEYSNHSGNCHFSSHSDRIHTCVGAFLPPFRVYDVMQVMTRTCTHECIAGSRSEALASLLLELHGLQDMLDGLREWVSGAESTMSAAEGCPVGNDMETVERQLSEHEVQQ